nr:uncharacterized protein LOC117222141 [Megalopta genalis]
MNIMEERIKKWILLIQTEELDEVIEDIQISICPGLINNVSKYVFKLLLHLSHTADKCCKQNCAIGMQIYRLTCLLCQNLIKIPDNNKFVCSLYHIVRCLLTVHMYKEAYKVCCFINTETLCSSDSSVNNILVKIDNLWHNSVNNACNLLERNILNIKYYYELQKIIKLELKLIQTIYKNYTKRVLSEISSYLDKIALISKKSNICFMEFCVFASEYLRQTKLFLKEDDKHVITRYMLLIMSKIVCENVNEQNLDFVINTLDNLSKHFKMVLKEDKECYECYKLLESFCMAAVKPNNCLVKNDANSIHDCCYSYERIAKKYDYLGSIKWLTFGIVQILESLFLYWETCIKTGNKSFLEKGILLEIMNLVVCTSKYFMQQTCNKCKSCQSKECMIRNDIYNVVVIKARCVNLISKLSADDLSKDMYSLAQNFLEQNVAHIYEMKQCNCMTWPMLWSTNGALIYNLGIMAGSFYEESVSLLSLLCTSIKEFEGIQQKSKYISLQNPICTTLHRLSSLHFNHGMYREAMTASALNALLSYNDPESKAFRMWANIKHKSITNKKIMEMTIISCLKSDGSIIEQLGLSIKLSQYDLIEICLREARSLQEAKVNLSGAICKVLDEMLMLKATPIYYARVVQMLVYHLLHFDYNENTLDYLKQAISNLKQIKSSNYVLCLQANLEFYIFVAHLHVANKKTEIEMENTTFALYAPKISEMAENDTHDVVPAYTMINIKEDSKMMMYLETALKKWNKCTKQNFEQIIEDHERLITLHTLIIAGEYARLYRYEKCEINIWKLAYKLASVLQDDRAIIYVTGRSISLRYINPKWITTVTDLANKYKETKDENMIYAIAVFWISLSDFYFERDMYEEARKLLDESRKLPGVCFLSNIALSLYSLDRLLYNCSLYKEDIKHEEYTRYVVETLYSLVNLNEELSKRKWKPQDKHLFDIDIFLSATINLSLRLNSLLSFREIGSHLVRRLKTAQSLGATMRVAEILKSLCYIDLSRSQLHDCEIKLQGLEHILNIETFEASMSSNPIKVITESALTPIRVVEPIRDIPRNDTSPVLRNKCFDLPVFMCHQNCNCYLCQNLSYNYLVFAGTHIRAQLYALQNNFTAALEHFTGAFKIKERIMKTEKCMTENEREHFSWQERFYSTDYILLLINFYSYLKNYLNIEQERKMNLLSLAIELCDKYKLKGHPVYMSAKELIADYSFQNIINRLDYSMFTVPDASDIDTTKYELKVRTEDAICVTPIINNSQIQRPTTLKRIRNPPFLKLSKVSMNFSDDSDDEDISSPKSQHRGTRSRNKLTKRKIFNEENSDSVSKTKEGTNESRSSSQKLKQQNENIDNVSMKDVVNKATSLVPNISDYLHNFADELEEPATNSNIQKLIKKIETLKINAMSQKATRSTRRSKQVISIDSTKIDEIIALFKDLKTEKRKDNNCLVSEIISDQRRTSEGDSIEILEEINTGKNTRTRITRKSSKQNVITREAQYKS